MTYFLPVSTKDDFLSVFARIWIHIHFPMENPVINFSQVIIQFVYRCIYYMCNKERRCLALEERPVARSLM